MLSFIWRKIPRRPSSQEPQSRFRPRLESLEDRRLPSGGVLDPTFGSGGLVNTPSNSNTGAHALATYPNEGTANDGKIVAGWVTFSSTGAPYMEVARYNLNGTLDTNFGGTGEVTNFKGYARGVAVQPDGKVIVAGWEPRGNFAAIRYNANGSVDTAFGTKGEAIIQFGRSGSYAYNVALQADGKIVLAGEVNGDVGLARLNTNGSLDTSFGAGGEVSTPLPYSLYAPDYKFNVTNLAIDPNSNASDSNGGKLLVSAEWQLTNRTTVVLRYNSNGTLDTTFGGGTGYVNLAGTGRPAVVVQPDDRTVVATNDSGSVLLARLNADGTLDASFGSGGAVLTPPPANSGVFADCVTLQANGQILVGGDMSTTSFGLMAGRWNTNGSLDTTFGSGGFAVASRSGQGMAIALEPDGRIVLAGNNIYSGGIELARFLAVGPQIGSLTASNLTITNNQAVGGAPARAPCSCWHDDNRPRVPHGRCHSGPGQSQTPGLLSFAVTDHDDSGFGVCHSAPSPGGSVNRGHIPIDSLIPAPLSSSQTTRR
jgi:uncharacterized delta-60 repeat protein